MKRKITSADLKIVFKPGVSKNKLMKVLAGLAEEYGNIILYGVLSTQYHMDGHSKKRRRRGKHERAR